MTTEELAALEWSNMSREERAQMIANYGIRSDVGAERLGWSQLSYNMRTVLERRLVG